MILYIIFFCYFDIRVGVKMGETIKKELILNGLHCANCANKIEKEVVDKTSVIKVAISILLLTLALVFEFHYWVELLLFLSSYLIIGWEIIYTAFKNVLKGRIFDENFLMSIATIGAFIIKEYPEQLQ